MTLRIKWKLKQDDLPSIRSDLCITGDEDVVAQSPGFPMWDPQQCPHPAGDRSLSGRLYSHVPLSSLGLACQSFYSNWLGLLRASILAYHALRERIARYQPLTLIFPIILCSTVGKKTQPACALLVFEGVINTLYLSVHKLCLYHAANGRKVCPAHTTPALLFIDIFQVFFTSAVQDSTMNISVTVIEIFNKIPQPQIRVLTSLPSFSDDSHSP